MAETAPVVIVNGVFVNGYMPFEPVYYFKPISGWGSVVRQYPGPFTAYLANSNKVVSVPKQAVSGKAAAQKQNPNQCAKGVFGVLSSAFKHLRMD